MLILAALQGLTEFLPVSSSGHLVLAQAVLNAREGDVFFDVILHIGTLGSVVLVYRHEIRRLLVLDAAALKYLAALGVGTVPAIIAGLILKRFIEGLFHSPVAAAGGLFVTAAVLFSTRYTGRPGDPLADPWQPEPLAARKALLIGCAQAFAILPGISRSGSTIAASLWLRVPRAEAARFSFLLSVPAIGGALLLQLIDRPTLTTDWPNLVVAALAAFGVGLLALRWTALAVVQAHFWKFSIYCAAVGTIALIVLR